MIHAEAFDSAHTTDVAVGKSTLASSPSVAAADAQSTAVKSAKRVHGFSTATGAWLLHREEDTNSYLNFVNHHRHWIYHWLHIAWRLAYYNPKVS